MILDVISLLSDLLSFVEPATPRGAALDTLGKQQGYDRSGGQFPEQPIWPRPSRAVFEDIHAPDVGTSSAANGLLGPAIVLGEMSSTTPRPESSRSGRSSSVTADDRVAVLESLVVALGEKVRDMRVEITGLRLERDETLAQRVAVHVALALRSVAQHAAGSLDWADALA